MEIILLRDIENLGKFGEIVRVRDGYGKNFLIPRNEAIAATKSNREYFDSQKSLMELENQKKVEFAKSLLGQIKESEIVILVQASEDGRLYGSVGSKEIVDKIVDDSKGSVKLERKQIKLREPLKYVGIHRINILLHVGVETSILVNIARDKEEADSNRNKMAEENSKKTDDTKNKSSDVSSDSNSSDSKKGKKKPAGSSRKTGKKSSSEEVQAE